MVHGEVWTIKELFVYPNEYIYWSVQIVMYPFMTGLVAGAFVLSSLYHVFGIKQLREMARFALVFSFALLFVAPMPIVLHLQHPFRGYQYLYDAALHLCHRCLRHSLFCVRSDRGVRTLVSLQKTFCGGRPSTEGEAGQKPDGVA